jgi:hypothetical protein
MMRAMVKAEIKPIWTSSSFLVYSGGLTVLLGAGAGLAYLAREYHGHGIQVAWTLLFLVIISGIAHALRARDRWIAAGIFAFTSVLIWGTLVLLTMRWIGWHPFGGGPSSYRTLFSEWSWSRMLFWVLVLLAASGNRMVFKFPFIRLISAVVFWAFLSDLLTSGHGSWFAVVTLFTGFLYLLVGSALDKPSAFWLHIVSGALLGGSFLYWFHDTDFDFAVISVVAFVYVMVAFVTKRSTWAFFGTLGFFLAAGHYVTGTPVGMLPYPAFALASSEATSPWAPALAWGLLGFFLVALGILGKPKRGHTHTAVVFQTPAPAVD